MKNLRLFLFLFALNLSLGACVSYDDYDTNLAEGSFNLAKKLQEDSRYEEAILQYRDVKNRFPYSRFSTEAELQLAEIHFAKDAFAEAQAAYQLFRELHPKHPKADYVTFMAAECTYFQLPSTIDRDLALAPLAIRNYKNLISEFPSSTHVAKSRSRIHQTYTKLAEKELYIADFYFRTGNFASALARYETYITEYTKHDRFPHALLQAGLAADKVGAKDKKAKYLQEIISKHPQTEQAAKAKRAL